ncbi:hypothetical protein [Citrobacter freundii]|uniref:hypothetical protein n=1 Tax=Citrobacter freundii TaxID=546 RepID=UPI00190811E4|nr:hypothetical protein [Citrobacter freundii]MBJ8931583.1 hypothetical protein [Citrobacter freundii]
MAKQENPLDKISKADKMRLTKAAYLLASRGRFLQWCSSFPAYEITSHPSVNHVKLLSYAQSGRFAIGIDNGEAFLGVQRLELAWLKDMPLDKITIDDMLYLSLSSTECINLKFRAFHLGIRCTKNNLLSQLKKLDYIRFVEIKVKEGAVESVGNEFREPVMLCAATIAQSIAADEKERRSDSGIISFL